MRAPTDRPAFCRVTLLTPRRRVDVALPADVPLAELVPLVLELVGEPRRPHAPVPWRFAGATGGPLPPGATLDGLGVVDGELLRIGPQVPAPTPPVFDDPVDALAAGAGPGGAGEERLRAGIAVGMTALAAVTLAVAATTATTATTSALVLAMLLAATGTAACLARAAGRTADPAPVTSAACAAAFAAAGGWATVPGPPGAGQLLAAAVAAGAAAAAGQVLVRVVAPALVAIVMVAAVLVGLAIVRLWLGVSAAALAAGAGTLALACGPLLPRAALRLAGLPLPAIPATADELVADARLDGLPPAELADRADLARGFLAGLVAGAAVVAAAAAVVAAGAGTPTGWALAGVLVTVTGLRARAYADRAPARTSLLAALVGAAGVAAFLVAYGGPVVRLVVAVAAGAAAVAAVATAGRAEPIDSPVSRRAVDLLEGALVAAAIPLALGVAGVYALVRGR